MPQQLPGEQKSGDFSENSPCIFIRINIQGGGGCFQKNDFWNHHQKVKVEFLGGGGGLFLPSEIELPLFDAESKNHIPENSPPLEIELLLFDAESKNHIPENSPPPDIELLLFDAESKNHIPENSPPTRN